MAMEAEVIQRPNGKPYRPRRVFAQAVGEEDEGVLVLGTHDVTRAQVLADKVARYVAGSGFVAVKPETGWWRDGFECGQRRWVADEENGRAGVLFRDIAETEPLAVLAMGQCPIINKLGAYAGGRLSPWVEGGSDG
jgi:hypothetical protein